MSLLDPERSNLLRGINRESLSDLAEVMLPSIKVAHPLD